MKMVRSFSPPISRFLYSGSISSRPSCALASAVTDGLTGFLVLDLIGLRSLDPSQRPEDVFSSPDQLSGELATLTLLPRSRWQTLLKLEVIQVCN